MSGNLLKTPHISYKRKTFKNYSYFFVIISISADPIFKKNVRSVSSDKEIMRNF